jgi:hypothetical protein
MEMKPMPSQQTMSSNGVPGYGAIDPTDVPIVAVRELATALKVLADDVLALARASEWSDADFRRVEQYFWQRCGRDRQRKIAALVRLRSLIAVCKARKLQKLLAEHGTAAALSIVEAAASMRLNTSVGFSPNKIAMAALQSLRDTGGVVRSSSAQAAA